MVKTQATPAAGHTARCVGVHKTFTHGDRVVPVLDDVHLTVQDGEFVSLIGPSGCGKSTLLTIIAGITPQTSGTVQVYDESADRLGLAGYMPQRPLLLPWKTVRENILLGPRLKKQSLVDARREADAYMQRFGLLGFADQYPHVLSGGMAQKVALLRTILYNRSFLLIDEPFGALDALTRMAMQAWLMDVCTKVGSSVLFVTHDIREAILLSDKIYVLSNRPATVVKEVTIPAARSRQRDYVHSRQGRLLEAELERLLVTP